jgi:hypothetical protein
MLTKKIDKTHKIVPVKRSKDRVKSTKWLGWDLCGSGIFVRGYL